MQELQDMIAQLDLYVYLLRKVKSGDLILSSDHNNIVDSIYQITRIIKYIYYNGLLGGGTQVKLRQSKYSPYEVLYNFFREIYNQNINLDSYFPLIYHIKHEEFLDCEICRESCADGLLLENLQGYNIEKNVGGETLIYPIRTLTSWFGYYFGDSPSYRWGYGIGNYYYILSTYFQINQNYYPSLYPQQGVWEYDKYGLLNISISANPYNFNVVILDNVLYIIWYDSSNNTWRNVSLFTFQRGTWYYMCILNMNTNGVLLVIYDQDLNKLYSILIDANYLSSISGVSVTISQVRSTVFGIYEYTKQQAITSTNNYVLATYYANSKIDWITYIQGSSYLTSIGLA